MASRELVEFGARVPSDSYREFRTLFPIYGATTWFINTALEAFLVRLRNDGDLQQLCVKAIYDMVEERRGEDESSSD